MALKKITNADTAGKGNVGQPDTPALTTTEMQEQMDSLPNLIIEFYNELVDKLSDTTGAAQIGAEIPTGISALGNVQSILNAYATHLVLCVAAKHSHANMQTLEGLSDTLFAQYDSLVNILGAITDVESTLSNSGTSIPYSSAVKNYIDNLDLRQAVLSAAYPVGCVYSCVDGVPSTVFGGTWTLIDTDDQGVSRYKRIG